MDHQTKDPSSSQLEAYLDGLLSDAERAAFEAELKNHPEWQLEIARQNSINERLASLYQAPVDRMVEATASGIGPNTTLKHPASGKVRSTVLAIAACLGLLVVAGWQIRAFLAPPTPPTKPNYAKQDWRDFGAVYEAEVASSFTPVWKCENDEIFAKFVKDRFGQPILLAALPAGVEALGWSYSNSISEETAQILGTVNGEKVLVFVDRAERDKKNASPRCGSVQAFSRQVGELVLYEVTPLDKPTFLDLAYIP